MSVHGDRALGPPVIGFGTDGKAEEERKKEKAGEAGKAREEDERQKTRTPERE